MQGERPARERSCASAVSALALRGGVAETLQQLGVEVLLTSQAIV